MKEEQIKLLAEKAALSVVPLIRDLRGSIQEAAADALASPTGKVPKISVGIKFAIGLTDPPSMIPEASIGIRHKAIGPTVLIDDQAELDFPE